MSAAQGIEDVPESGAGVTQPSRRESVSQRSEDSQTAADFIRDQMQLEADAREALPYSIENCTKPLGSLRQNVFACLTCHPPPTDSSTPFTPAGVCYSCSVQCHGEHELVEIFQKRNFTCDCGTTRFTPEQTCSLRVNPDTNTKGGVHSEPADPNNKYNQNFRNRFCSCSIDYNPDEQKGTMFQCLGLSTHDNGGCGEDWYHPGCLVGLGPRWFESVDATKSEDNVVLPSIAENPHPNTAASGNGDHPSIQDNNDDPPPPDGFPEEDEFDQLICYKCVENNPWIKQYAGTAGFLPAVYLKRGNPDSSSKKRMHDEVEGTALDSENQAKRLKSEQPECTQGHSTLPTADNDPIEIKEEGVKEGSAFTAPGTCKLNLIAPTSPGQLSLFAKDGFREHLCRCPDCFPKLKPHPQLLEEEEAYEPPLSDTTSENGASTHGSGSIYDRGESALRNVDRVRAIEGVMAYNHLKDQLTPFFKRFAESGESISAEDIRDHFAKLRGDHDPIKEAGESAKDYRKEESGY